MVFKPRAPSLPRRQVFDEGKPWSDPSADSTWGLELQNPPISVPDVPFQITRSDMDQSVALGGLRMTAAGTPAGVVQVKPREGSSTLRVAYFFSGTSRKASVGDELRKLCQASGIGLLLEEIDIYIYNGGTAHDLLDKASQADFESKIRQGDYDVVVVTPPCATWSRAPYSPYPGPKPVRSAEHPWGFPDALQAGREKARKGNEFIHFAIHAMEAAVQAQKRNNITIRVLLEHPEDLGTTPKGTPASIWQLPEIREFVWKHSFIIAAGHQCQFAVD